MDTFTIWMLCIVGMMVLYGIFAVVFSLTGAKATEGVPPEAGQKAKGKGAGN